MSQEEGEEGLFYFLIDLHGSVRPLDPKAFKPSSSFSSMTHSKHIQCTARVFITTIRAPIYKNVFYTATTPLSFCQVIRSTAAFLLASNANSAV